MTNTLTPQIVEIIGPAGAGKTTLTRALTEGSRTVQLGGFPDVRRISDLPFFLWHGLQISPALFICPRGISRKLTRREFAWLSILHGWPSILQKQLKKNRTILLDQGPVYLLAETNRFGPEYLRRKKAENFWHDLYSRWSNTLDMVIWLDAADADLVKRIRSRDKGHVLKNETVESAFEFLSSYRKAYEQTISILMAGRPNLKILRFDTSRTSLGEITDRLLPELKST
jgi:deoxyadenosine/deoxycytidine kinase